ncbi:LysM peptidoglycan-binding domain-containing protein [Rubrivirga sp.]|uniref:LysM peptidoglycan-binding domain-containing protein n=1 Tax=Rubrivirga sp. TaxID=1885344 RepID=UPI003C77C024
MRSIVAAFAVLAFVPVAPAQVASRLADLRLSTAVRLALVDDDRTRPLDVEVAAWQGAVVLAGRVPSPDQSSVVAVARSVPGVRTVSGLGAGDGPSGPVVTVPDRPRPSDSSSRPASTDRVVHTVERGDTVFGLARRYGTTVGAILELNGTVSTSIQIGQRLRVR